MQLDEFYDAHVTAVYKFFYIKCLNRSTAEDLTSDTFVSFMQKAELTHIDDHKKYLYGIMRNTWLQFLRNKYQQALVDIENIEDFESVVHTHNTKFDDAASVENRLLPFIEKLPEKQRQIVILRYIDNLSIADIAQQIGKDRNYVKTTCKRGIARLRSLLEAPYMEVAI